MPLTIRTATEEDIGAVSKLDATYAAGQRVLSLSRSGTRPELTFSLRWHKGAPREALYGEYTDEGIRRALAKTDLFLVAVQGDAVAGLLMVVVPDWTDAGEITDLVVDRRSRRRGVGRALVHAAADWARERSLRALWVEPRAENADAIDFYTAIGFRVSGFNDRLHANTDDAEGRPTILMYRELR